MIFKAMLPKKTWHLQNNVQKKKEILWSNKLGKCDISFHPLGKIHFPRDNGWRSLSYLEFPRIFNQDPHFFFYDSYYDLLKTVAFCILHIGFAALCFVDLFLQFVFKEGNSRISGLSIHFITKWIKLLLVTGFYIVIVISVRLLNKVHAGMKLTGDTFSVGHSLWT